VDRDKLKKKLKAWAAGKIPQAHDHHVRDAMSKTHGGRGSNRRSKSKGWKASQHRHKSEGADEGEDEVKGGHGAEQDRTKKKRRGKKGRGRKGKKVLRVAGTPKSSDPRGRLGPGEELRSLPDGRTFVYVRQKAVADKPSIGGTKASETGQNAQGSAKALRVKARKKGSGSKSTSRDRRESNPWGQWDRDLPDIASSPDPRPDSWGALLQPWTNKLSEDSVIHIGIDAGTSGIRVASQAEFTEGFGLFDFGPNRAGGSRFSLPALAGYVDGHIVFGNDAAELTWAQRFASFKAGLIYPTQSRGATERWAKLGLPYAEALQGDVGPRVPELLYAASIGRALTLALPELVGDIKARFLSFSVGAPLDDTDVTYARFARAFSAGVLLGGLIEDRMEPGVLVERFAAAWRDARGPAGASDADRRVLVRHEAQLLVRSLEDLIIEGRTFLVADIGASTTEVSILRRGGGVLRVWESRSVPLGVDRADLQSGAGKRVDLIRNRQARMDGSGGTDGVPALVDALRREIRRALHLAVQRNPDERSWSEVRVVVAGGGSNIPKLRRALEAGRRPHHWVAQRIAHRPTIPSVAVCGASSRSPTVDEAPELVCVLGAARSPDDDIQYSTVRPETIIPFYENPEAEIYRQRHARWL
jgi:hypothetical protein